MLLCHLVGEDYSDASHRLVLSSEQKRVCLTVHIRDDDIAESEEGFTCVLSHSDPRPPLLDIESAVASISIEDNEGTGFCDKFENHFYRSHSFLPQL